MTTVTATSTNNAIAARLPLAGGTMTGDVDFDDNKITDVTLENFQRLWQQTQALVQ